MKFTSLSIQRRHIHYDVRFHIYLTDIPSTEKYIYPHIQKTQMPQTSNNPYSKQTSTRSTLTEYQRALLTNIWEKLNNRKAEFEILERDDFSANCKHGIISRCLDDLSELDLKAGHFAEVAPSKAIFVHLAPLIANESERVSVLTYHVQEIRDLDEEEDFPEVKKRFEKVQVILENILLRREDIMNGSDEPSTAPNKKRFFTICAPNYRYVLAKTSRTVCMRGLGFTEKELEDRQRGAEFEVLSL